MASKYEQEIKQLHLIIGDRDDNDRLYTDEEYTTLLDMNKGNVYLAGADALDGLAANAAYVLKVITILDVRTDGKATAEALRASAKALRDKVKEDDANAVWCGVISLPGTINVPTEWRPWWEAWV